ncbi:MAG: radical SAM-associated putative lipoprotein [Tannerellaceae bacterium]|jgi:putative lipoprotein (rSAM/lipoprotein system)|nr:radical SAM-associated putative lipoprotein [Tannerellaceae bacterium]
MKHSIITRLAHYAPISLAAISLLTPSCTPGGDASEGHNVPTMNYIISGATVSESAPEVFIPGLEVVISCNKPHPSADTVITDSNGRFTWEGAITTFGKSLTLNVTVNDIDGEENSSYSPFSTQVSFDEYEDPDNEPEFIGEAKQYLLIKMPPATATGRLY